MSGKRKLGKIAGTGGTNEFVDGGVDPRFEDAMSPNRTGSDEACDAVHLEREERRAGLGGGNTRSVLISFAVRPTTGDVVCGFEIVSCLKSQPQTTEQMEALVASGYGRKDDKRIMITLSSGSNTFGERVAATEVLLDWTDWSDSPARGLNRFVPFDSSGRPVWVPTCALSMGNAKLHLLVGAELAEQCDFYVLVRSLLSDSLRRATEKGKCWKLPNGRELVYNAHAKPGGHLRVE
jgi:hypothetical protein